MKTHDLSHFKALFLAGERTDPDTLHWAEKSLGVPVIDHWWQTETGWAIAANCLGLHQFPVKEGAVSRIPHTAYRTFAIRNAPSLPRGH